MYRMRRFCRNRRVKVKDKNATNGYDKDFTASSSKLFRSVEKALRSIQVFEVTVEEEILTTRLKPGGGAYSLEIDKDNKCLFLLSPVSGRSTYEFNGKKWISFDGSSFDELFAREISRQSRRDVELQDLSPSSSYDVLKNVQQAMRAIQDSSNRKIEMTAHEDILTIKFKPSDELYSLELDNDNKCLFFLSPLSGRSTFEYNGKKWISQDGSNFEELFAREMSTQCGGNLQMQ